MEACRSWNDFDSGLGGSRHQLPIERRERQPLPERCFEINGIISCEAELASRVQDPPHRNRILTILDGLRDDDIEML